MCTVHIHAINKPSLTNAISAELDNGLFSLDLGEDVPLPIDKREWLRVAATGQAPSSRAYHAMAATATTLYIYGGLVEGESLNSLLAFLCGALQ
jgi:hypothetical protein